MPDYPPLADVEEHIVLVRKTLRAAGLPSKVLQSIGTKALRTGRKVTGEHATDRDPRWRLAETHPQYGTENDCKLILVKLRAQIFNFDNSPPVPQSLRELWREVISEIP